MDRSQGLASRTEFVREPQATEVALPSGRSLVVRSALLGEDEIELRAPGGEVEVRIVCRPEGPVVTVRAARLELEAPSLAVRCRDLDVQATEEAKLAAKDLEIRGDGELVVKTGGDVRVNGAFIRLNCTEEST